MMRRSRDQADDELPDAVVRMYRETLDEDGLDFLRRGPRSAAERLAYAQRVHPEAYRTAAPAPALAQAAFAQGGSLDGRRHFVGPDRNLYRRGEATAEPPHARIRRGFETAVPGFQPASFRRALAEMDALSSGGKATPTDGGSERTTLTQNSMASSARAADPQWLEAGPLRARQIQAWSLRADPGDAASLDQDDRMDALRYLRFLHGGKKLSEEQLALGREIYGGLEWDRGMLTPQRERLRALMERISSDPGVQDALTRWQGGNKWSTLSPEQKGAALAQIVESLSKGLGLAIPNFTYRPLSPDIGGQYTVENRSLELGSTTPYSGLPDLEPISVMSDAGHEVGHAWQDDLRNRGVAGTVGSADPDYALAELAALSYPFFIPHGSVEEDRYSKQLLEEWANAVGDMLFGELRRRWPPVLERSPE